MSRRADRCACRRNEAGWRWMKRLNAAPSQSPRSHAHDPPTYVRFGDKVMRAQMTLRSRPDLSGAVYAIFETSQLLGADRSARMEFAGRDADFRAEPEFAAGGKLRRGVVQHDRRIDLVEKPRGHLRILG